MLTKQARLRVQQLRDAVEKRTPGLLESHTVGSYIDRLDATSQEGRYTDFAPDILAIERAIREEAGSEACDDYHKLVMASLIERFPSRVQSHRIPDSVRSVFEAELARMLDDMDSNPAGSYVHSNDVFRKDLCSCLLRMYPCGAQVVDTVAGIARRPLFTGGGIAQALRAGWYFLFRAHGFSRFYEIHTHTPTLSEFNADGWDRCYVRIADLLKLNPEIRGFYGASWFYDPALEEISPRLGYLRHRPTEGGARFFRLGSFEASRRDALATSKTRRRLFEEGKYLPTHYLMVWERNDVIDWAKNSGIRTNVASASNA